MFKYILGLLVGLFVFTSIGLAGENVTYQEVGTYTKSTTFYSKWYSMNDVDSLSATLILADSIDVDAYSVVKLNIDAVNSLDSTITSSAIDSLAGTEKENLTIKRFSINTYAITDQSFRFKFVTQTTGMQATQRKPYKLIINVYKKH